MASNAERQTEEIEAISSICNDGEFFRLSGEYYELGLNIPPYIDKGVLDVKCLILTYKPLHFFHHFKVKNLPPACLRVHLPPEYPESAPPEYKLDISWLSPWECSLVCQRIDDLTKENEGCEILYIWQYFLRNEILGFLKQEESLDVSFLLAVYCEPENLGNIELLRLADPRAKNGALFLQPVHYLSQYDEFRRSVVHRQNFHICEICFGEFSGKRCTELRRCGHVYCNDCVAAYFATRIKSGNVAKILCPDFHCYTHVQSNQIKELCPDLYPKYEELLLNLTLKKMNDVVFCPRVFCQLPVIVTDGETLASCSNCEYNFCIYCRKGYHGVAPCVMTSEDTDELIATYLKANKAQKKLLTKKYGRKQIQTIVENYLTKKYIKENTKPCPECRTPTEKIDGCNKMVCIHCQANFCWICGLRITNLNSYEHFTIFGVKNACYGRLFEGMTGIDDFPYNNEIAEID